MRPYDNSRTVANEHEILAEFKRTSLVSYQKFTHIADIQYGKHSRSTLDLFPLEQAKRLLFLFMVVIGNGVINQILHSSYRMF